MVEDMFDTHKFLFTMAYNEEAQGHKVEYLDKNNETKIIEIKELIVNTSPVSFRVITPENIKVAIGYLRVVKIFNKNNELVWDVSDNDTSNIKVIGGYDK